MIQYIFLQPQQPVDLCTNRVGHGKPKMSQQMISWGITWVTEEKSQEKNFIPVIPCTKSSDSQKKHTTYPEKTWERRKEKAKGDC